MGAPAVVPEEDWETVWTPPEDPRAPVTDFRAAALSVYPDLHINQVERDPDSRLGRANPTSWHIRTHAAGDSRPFRDMTFDEYVQGYRDAGYEILESRDEVANPSAHATGPHWHVVLGQGTAPPADQWETVAPAAAAPAPPAPPQSTGDDAMRARIRALHEPAASRGFAGTPRAHQQFAPTTETGPVPEDAHVERATTRDDPRLAGVNSQLRAMYADPNVTPAEMSAFLTGHGVSPAQIPNWSAAMTIRPRYLAAPPRQRGPLVINLDDIQLPPDQQGDVVVTRGALPAPSPANLGSDFQQATISEHRPGVTERTGTAFGNLVATLGGDRRSGTEAGRNLDDLLSNPLSPVQALEYAGTAEERRQRSIAEGRILDTVGNEVDRDFAALGIIPVVGRARAGAQLAREALAEAEGLALRYGAGEGDDALAAVVRERWAELPEDVRGLIAGAPGGDGANIGAAEIAALRSAANNPSLLERGMARVRRALGAREEAVAPAAVEAVPSARQVDRLDIPGSPAVLDDAARAGIQPLGRDARYAVEDAPAQARGMEPGEVLPDPALAVPADAERPMAGNIRLDNITSREDIRRVLSVAAEHNDDFADARRGVRTHEETAAAAERIGLPSLLSRRRGQAANAEQLHRYVTAVEASGDNVATAAVAAQGGSDEALATFQRAWVTHVAIQEELSGATAEAGRALNILNRMARSADTQQRALKQIIDLHGGRENLETIAAMIANLKNDPAAMNRAARQAFKATRFDQIYEAWINGMLSGPQTHVRNIAGNMITTLMQVPEHALAAVIGRVRSPTGANMERVLGSEVGARAFGMVQGVADGVPAFVRAIKTGEASDLVSRLETAQHAAIPGKLGTAIRAPSRVLTAEDEFFKAIARRMEISAQAARTARKEGVAGEAYRDRVAYLVANPTDAMMTGAADYARYLTYQRDLVGFGKDIQQLRNRRYFTREDGTGGIAPFKVIAPFVRVTGNIMKFAIERTPAAPLLREVRAAIRAGGAQRDVAIARVLIGSGIGATAALWASQGTLTGNGPADPSARRLLLADGWQPYSVRIGDRYVSYRGLEPFATLFGVAADMVGVTEYLTDRQQENVSTQIFAAVLNQLSSKSYLATFGNLMEAVQDPNRFGESFLAGLAGSVVPGAIAQYAPVQDPILRDARGILDRVQSRIPGLSDDLHARHDVWGREIVREGSAGPDYLSPFRQSTRRNDPVTRELLEAGVSLAYPSRRVQGRDLTDDEYDRYSQLAGQYLRESAEALVQGDDWADMDRDERRRAFDSIKDEARRDAREDLMLDAAEQ